MIFIIGLVEILIIFFSYTGKRKKSLTFEDERRHSLEVDAGNRIDFDSAKHISEKVRQQRFLHLEIKFLSLLQFITGFFSQILALNSKIRKLKP